MLVLLGSSKCPASYHGSQDHGVLLHMHSISFFTACIRSLKIEICCKALSIIKCGHLHRVSLAILIKQGKTKSSYEMPAAAWKTLAASTSKCMTSKWLRNYVMPMLIK